MFSRILLPVDGSEHACKAAALAGDLATRYAAGVVVLHVLDPSDVGPEEQHMAEVEHIVEPGHEYAWLQDVPAELNKMLEPADSRTQREQVLGFLAREVVGHTMDRLREHGVDPGHVRVLFKNGNAAKRILETVDEQEVDLVVMGSRGLSDVGALVQGSVSHRVAHAAPCTVATVK
ncbi:MAG: universal stress protein [Halofilum sp. (in: g-proteobacteria)]|nr:universal stress protein [Halofilum sp. (in: g-proteobacteria)]